MKLTMTAMRSSATSASTPNKRLIGLLPGSRRREVDALLPVMLEAAAKSAMPCPTSSFSCPRLPTLDDELIREHLVRSEVEVRVLDSFRYNIRAAADFALVASGTATLETGILGCPMVILYRVSALTAAIGKVLAKVRYVGLINLVAEELVAPNCFRNTATRTRRRRMRFASCPIPRK
jgi:lipid-A-disaccharide synthase